MIKRIPKAPERQDDCVFGLMNNRGFATPKPPKYYTFKGGAPAVIPNMPKWDLPEDRFCLMDFSCDKDTTFGTMHAQTEDGTIVPVWRDPNGYRNLFWPAKIQDFSSYTHLEFMLYSPHATGGTFALEIRGDWANRGAEPPYLRSVMKLNWTGWRAFSIPLATLDASFGGVLEHVGCFGFHSTGWENSLYAVPSSYIYFSSFYLTRRASDYQVDANLVTPQVLDALRTRWKALLVGDEELSTTYPGVQNTLKLFSQSGKKWYETINRDPSISYLYEDCKNMDEGPEIQIVVERLFYMARAWSSLHTETYHDPKILETILFGLDWVWEHAYGDCRLKRGISGNWWQWAIGIPWAMTKCILLIYDEVTLEQIKHWLSFADHHIYYPRMTNANRTWISYCCVLSALMQNDVPRLIECLRRMQTVFGYVDQYDGFYLDGSFIMHANKAYIGGYGSNYLFQLSDFFYLFANSPLAIPEKYAHMTVQQFLDSYVPMIYKGIMQKSVCGRGVLGNGMTSELCMSALKLVPVTTKEEQQKLFAFIKYCCKNNSTFLKDLERRLEPVTWPYYQSLMDTKEKDFVPFAKVFNGMDRAIAQQDSFCASIAYASSRTCRWESINGQNTTGWYQNEGSLCVTTTDLFHFDGNYYRDANPYRFPGTTVTTAPRVDGGVVFLPCGTYAFGGGVYKDDYALAATHIGYEPFVFNYGYDFKSDLELYKSWFMFPDGILCLNCGITSTDDESVYTTIDTRRTNEDSIMTCDGKPFEIGEEDQAIKGRFITHSEFGTYYFLDDYDLYVHLQKGNHNDYFELLVDHGIKPQNKTLSYILLPMKNLEEAKAYLKAHPIVVKSNTEDLMAATMDGCSVYAFFKAGSYDGITTSHPVTILVKEQGNTCEISVNEPTQMQPQVELTFDGIFTLVSGEATSKIAHGKTIVTLDTNHVVGVQRTFTLKK